MILKEDVPLSTITTLRVGGPARFVVRCVTEEDILEGIRYAKERNLPLYVLGQGSNLLASDQGFEGVVLKIETRGIHTETTGTGVLITVQAGVPWETLVKAVASESLWGLENLAGIPGTVGAAPVQNIGAYGMEVKDTIEEVKALDTVTEEARIFTTEQCAFGYRESMFKHAKNLLILSVTFRLHTEGEPRTDYKDLTTYIDEHGALKSPQSVGDAVRSIRARKFPDLQIVGTAGSFFKNPTISLEAYARLQETYEAIPGFPNSEGIKIPLAFVLDKVLNLRGYTEGNVSLFEEQPLVLVAHEGASSDEIHVFAKKIAQRVYDVTGITIEREVQNIL